MIFSGTLSSIDASIGYSGNKKSGFDDCPFGLRYTFSEVEILSGRILSISSAFNFIDVLLDSILAFSKFISVARFILYSCPMKLFPSSSTVGVVIIPVFVFSAVSSVNTKFASAPK